MNDKRHKMAVAVHLFLIRNEEVLLLRRFNTGYEDGKYSVIAGHIDEGEDFVSAMMREAKEEAGIDIAYKDLIPVQVMHRKNGNDERVDYFFVTEKWTGNIVNMEPGKCDELSWHKMNALPDNAIPYVASSINSYLAKETFTSYGWK